MYYYVVLCNKEACFDTVNRPLRMKKYILYIVMYN